MTLGDFLSVCDSELPLHIHMDSETGKPDVYVASIKAQGIIALCKICGLDAVRISTRIEEIYLEDGCIDILLVEDDEEENA